MQILWYSFTAAPDIFSFNSCIKSKVAATKKNGINEKKYKMRMEHLGIYAQNIFSEISVDYLSILS